jgi:tripartite-type tricarboxylate transporter receptor subunit TctC
MMPAAVLRSDAVRTADPERHGAAAGRDDSGALVGRAEHPPLNEARVPGFDAAGWFMAAGPAVTPKPIVERLHAEFKTIMGLPDAQEAVDRTGWLRP